MVENLVQIRILVEIHIVLLDTETGIQFFDGLLHGGKRFGYLGSLTVDPVEAGLPWPAGTTSWGGIYGHIWSIDPLSGISMVSLTNTALYGGEGAFPQALREAIYAP